MKGKQSVVWTIIGIGIAFAVWYLKQKEEVAVAEKEQSGVEQPAGKPPTKLQKEVKSRPTVATPQTEVKTKAKPQKRQPVVTSEADGMLKVARVTDSKFRSLKGCRFVERKYGNDGDSFMVKHPEGKTEFRLYYVDTCESWFNKRYAEKSAKRLKEQGDYFGGLSREHTIKVGEVAKKYVAKILKAKPFTVVTKWEPVYSSERMYAFVIIEHEGEQRYLHELLVAKGLARIHTKPMPLPDSTSSSRQREHLRKLEQAAKAGKVGAWSIKK